MELLLFFITDGFKKNAEEKEKELLDSKLSSWSKIFYLEVLDASFSIDGIIGVFAFTIIIIIIYIIISFLQRNQSYAKRNLKIYRKIISELIFNRKKRFKIKINLMEVKNYNLVFDFDLENKRFYGKEIIDLELKNDYEEFVLDNKELKINELRINGEKQIFIDDIKGIVLKNLYKGNNKIFIDFEGELKEVLGGIYLSRYKDKEKDKFLITTQFEPIEARKAFPCIDHPGYKATFDLTLIIPKELKAISNTLPIGEEISGDKKKIVFETTPKMSTYLLYLGVGDFYFKEDKYKDVLIRVVATPEEKLKGADFALESTKKFLSYLEEYFNEPYPLKKIDLIAIPDFAAGAMENWGAITFRENLLLAFEGITPLVNKQRIAEVIAHELTHMWFGNLVTMQWWEDLWLNESFATYLAYKAVDNFYPEWKIKDEYVVTEVFSALDADSLNSSHPIKVEIKDPNESNEIFDEISYEKGGSVLRMIENYLGEEKFRDGLRNYIKKYKYQNASANDLWQSLEEVSKVNVVEIMKDFIEKVGYPIVSLTKENDKYYLSQKRFLFLENIFAFDSPPETTHSNFQVLREHNLTRWNESRAKTFFHIWKIPMIISFADSDIKIILDKKEQEVKLKENSQTLILNKDYSGFYLTSYDEEIFNKNLENLENLSEIDILHLVHDFWYLVKKGEKKLNELFTIFEVLLNKEKIYPFVYSEVLGILNYIDYYLEDQKSKELVEKFSLQALNILGKEPKEKELPFEIRLREQAIVSLGKVKNREILAWSQNKFEEFLKKPNSIHPDIKLSILSNSVFISNENFKKVLEYFRKTNIIEEKNRCLLALGKTIFENKLKELLEFSFSEEVRFSQIPFLLTSWASNSISKNWGFSWLKENWNKIEEKGGGLGKSDFVLISILKRVVPSLGAFVSDEKLNEFFEREEVKRFVRTKNVVIEKAKINRNFLRKNGINKQGA